VPLDLGGAELPPEDLASLGSKRICNPEDLRTFGTLKARAVNLLERNGRRFLSGFTIPETRLDDISAELSVIRKEFNEAREHFLRGYDQVCTGLDSQTSSMGEYYRQFHCKSGVRPFQNGFQVACVQNSCSC
jgi:hypothetical protein